MYLELMILLLQHQVSHWVRKIRQVKQKIKEY